MKPIEIKKTILSLQKKAIACLSDIQQYKINGGMVTSPSPKPTLTLTAETVIGCPCTHICEPTTN